MSAENTVSAKCCKPAILAGSTHPAGSTENHLSTGSFILIYFNALFHEEQTDPCLTLLLYPKNYSFV